MSAKRHRAREGIAIYPTEAQHKDHGQVSIFLDTVKVHSHLIMLAKCGWHPRKYIADLNPGKPKGDHIF